MSLVNSVTFLEGCISKLRRCVSCYLDCCLPLVVVLVKYNPSDNVHNPFHPPLWKLQNEFLQD